jgi:hypothetical protein
MAPTGIADAGLAPSSLNVPHRHLDMSCRTTIHNDMWKTVENFVEIR